MALWGGRFDGATSALFKQFNDSLPFDRRLVEQDITGSLAWAKAIAHAGVISRDELATLDGALQSLLAKVRANPDLLAAAADEDVHSWVERELVALVGDLGKKLHTGRSRNDQVATDIRLWTVGAIDGLIHLIRAAQRSLVAFAERELAAKTALPGYTHMQRGQPVLLAHWAMAYVAMLDRDAERLLDASRRAAVSPLGSGALAGTAYAIDRVQLSRDLGFEGRITANSLDAVSDRDFAFETLSACVLCSLHLSRLGEDLVLYSSSEFGFVQMDDSVTSGSSLMPQKKNPDAMELIRGKSGRVLGSLVTLATVLKGLPLAYNKDLQEDKEPLFDAVDTLAICLQMVPPCIDGMKVNRDRCRAAADDGVIAATDLADYLVRQGVPFRDAHHISGRLVRRALELGTSLIALSLAEMQAIDPRIGEDIRQHLTIDAMLAKRSVPGATGLQPVADAIDAARRRLAM
jgi:argininosuccinate lyase/amino-acid N-acetyltransferase